MQKIITDLFDSLEKLKLTIAERYNVSENRARAEYEYRTQLGREMAVAKSAGMAKTALYEYCRSLEKITKLREERDILIVKEEYLTELIYYYRTSVRVYEGEAAAGRKGL